MTLYWNQNIHTIGIKHLDEQHQQLFETLSRLHDSSHNGTIETEIPKIIDFMEDYSKKHFRDEETLMQEYNYQGLNEQQSEHAKFIAKIEEFKSAYATNGATINLALTIHNTLSTWLVEHISSLDRTMGLFLLEKIK
ncbi:MAG TPA: hemerythrin family protein [Bacillota bacterium]|jgi:hemerythrin|nr:hemerythrin family protein [Bacillota bacterium]HOL10052.1 hemerythrin family protein [Bacillota bacterium]HPO98536.1 hemerythrin family protein [Bacillota bacterium]